MDLDFSSTIPSCMFTVPTWLSQRLVFAYIIFTCRHANLSFTASHVQGAPLCNIFHAGGTLADALLPQQSHASLRTVLAPKVQAIHTWLNAYLMYKCLKASVGSRSERPGKYLQCHFQLMASPFLKQNFTLLWDRVKLLKVCMWLHHEGWENCAVASSTVKLLLCLLID